MPSLFTYRVTHDTGFAPNPFGGICTLVTCKPKIRLAAMPGDWIAAIAASNKEVRRIRNRLVYAMRVSRKLTMEEYDQLARTSLKMKVADARSSDPVKRVGDSIFDFRHDTPTPRPSMHSHSPKTLAKDQRGGYALLSDHFYYFGDKAIELPTGMLAIFPQSQGHRSAANHEFFDDFVAWIEALGFPPKMLIGQPIQPTSPIIGQVLSCAPGKKVKPDMPKSRCK